MNWKTLSFAIGLVAAASLASCAGNPTSSTAPSNQPAADTSSPGSAMSGDAMKGDAMKKEQPGSAMSGDAMKKEPSGSAMSGDAMSSPATKP